MLPYHVSNDFLHAIALRSGGSTASALSCCKPCQACNPESKRGWFRNDPKGYVPRTQINEQPAHVERKIFNGNVRSYIKDATDSSCLKSVRIESATHASA